MKTISPKTFRTGSAFLTAFVLVLVALVGPAQAESADPREATLKFSLNPDRSAAIPLNGVGTRLDSDVAVFLETSINPRSIFRVTFFVNGQRFNRESRAPYDLGSTLRGGEANLVEIEDVFDVGPQTIRAVVQRWFGNPLTVEGTLNVLPEEPTIVEFASGLDDFSILVEALVAADLVGAVSGPDPITVFAPTNTAFAGLLELLEMSKEELFAETDLLRKVLTYHVLPNALFAEAVLANDQLSPLQGEPIQVDVDNLRVNNSNLIGVDNAVSNGVIHAVDAVLLPPSITDPKPTIAAFASELQDFSILVEAAVETGLVGLLSADGPKVTVFAPTNAAFVALLGDLGLSKDELFDNKALLTTVLLYHLVNQELFASDVLAASKIFPMESEPIIVDADAVQLNGVDILTTDIQLANGVLHVIDGVLVPPAATQLLGN